MRAGSATARDHLYRRFSRRVAGYLTLMTADHESVPDLTQEVFLKAFESAGSFQGEPAAVMPWLLVIAKHTAADHRRRNARLRPEEPAVLDRRRDADPSPESAGWGSNASIHRVLDGLPRDQHRVLTLRYCAGLDVAEIARVLGKSPDAVRHLESRALASIRGRLAGSQPAA
jgi:RNA polymerase sigma factor (sigma-70 family)